MLLELIATFSIGLGVAGIVLLVNKLTSGALPRWLAPTAAGCAMIAFTIWAEYFWYNRATAALPEGVDVIWVNEDQQPYRPWTYIAPLKNRFTALDTETVKTNDAHPDQRLVDLYFMARWSAGHRVQVIVDCAGQRRADLIEGVPMNASGTVDDAYWIALGADDPVLNAVCIGEAAK